MKDKSPTPALPQREGVADRIMSCRNNNAPSLWGRAGVGLLLCLALAGCIEPYEAITKKIDGILVVEGFITNGTSKIKLSKSVELYAQHDFVPVDHAFVYVACDDGNYSQNTFSSGNGIYMIQTGELKTNAKYSLFINVNDTVYQSEFHYPTITPPVDIEFLCDDDDIHVSVTTLGNDDQTGYYLWSYKEDWEIHAAMWGQWLYEEKDGKYVFVNGDYNFVRHDLNSPDNRYNCWITDSSKIFIIGATDNLIDNDIRQRKLKSFPRTDDRTSVLYRIQVNQNRISKDAYDYFNNLQKNMDQAGSIFSRIPSEIVGNINCISNPEVPVLGYVDVSTTTMDIQYMDDQFWDTSLNDIRSLNCARSVTPPPWPFANPTPYNVALESAGLVLYHYTNNIPYYISHRCVNCILMGGTKIKPKDWPNDNI